ncbi:hypothetical protein [Nonomuraea sp. NPDC049625]|uniref:hypothetical protein n=1 Tax=Nonomuraea sp. NPDC049625 TaxID=3155775 RepID=UPI00342F0B2A
MLDDQRIDAGLNMDGHLFTDLGEVAERGLDHPVFLCGGAGNGSRMAGPISCAKYGLEVPVGGGGPTLMIIGVTREPAA